MCLNLDCTSCALTMSDEVYGLEFLNHIIHHLSMHMVLKIPGLYLKLLP